MNARNEEIWSPEWLDTQREARYNAMRAELDLWRGRYEALRRCDPRTFSGLYLRHLECGKPFDSLVDEMVHQLPWHLQHGCFPFGQSL